MSAEEKLAADLADLRGKIEPAGPILVENIDFHKTPWIASGMDAETIARLTPAQIAAWEEEYDKQQKKNAAVRAEFALQFTGVTYLSVMRDCQAILEGVDDFRFMLRHAMTEEEAKGAIEKISELSAKMNVAVTRVAWLHTGIPGCPGCFGIHVGVRAPPSSPDFVPVLPRTPLVHE